MLGILTESGEESSAAVSSKIVVGVSGGRDCAS